MAKVGAQRAAELTGRSKSTIQRSMNSGKLSYELDANDRRIIDVSELERVFGLAPQGAAQSTGSSDTVEVELKKASDLIEMERMKMRIKALEDQLDMKEEQLDDVKAQRDQWQKQAQQVLITSQYSQQQAEELKAELRDRDERAKIQRQRAIEERSRRMQGQNENGAQRPVQQHPAQRPQPSATPQGTATTGDGVSSGIDFQTLWKKIKGEKAA
jgi:hypothetical protein